MVDPEEVEQIQTDLELVTKTAKVLATKLEKISNKIDEMLSSLDQVKTQSRSTAPKTSPQPEPTPKTQVKTTEPAQTRDTGTVAYDGTNPKVVRFFESFLSQIQSLSSGKDISQALSSLRDQVMQSADVGFHPAFHEMGKLASRLKNQRLISEDERQALIENLLDWKARLS